MKYRLLGHSGLRVSELALGTMTFGDDWGWGSPKDEARKIYDAYREAGGNFVDTANFYTDDRARLGRDCCRVRLAQSHRTNPNSRTPLIAAPSITLAGRYSNLTACAPAVLRPIETLRSSVPPELDVHRLKHASLDRTARAEPIVRLTGRHSRQTP